MIFILLLVSAYIVGCIVCEFQYLPFKEVKCDFTKEKNPMFCLYIIVNTYEENVKETEKSYFCFLYFVILFRRKMKSKKKLILLPFYIVNKMKER